MTDEIPGTPRSSMRGLAFVGRDGRSPPDAMESARAIELWPAPPEMSEPMIWKAKLYIEGHPDFDPPHQVPGASQLQATLLATRSLDQWLATENRYVMQATWPTEAQLLRAGCDPQELEEWRAGLVDLPTRDWPTDDG